jgi:hypothetical protein
VRVRLLPPPFRAPAPVLVLCASERRSPPSPRASPLPFPAPLALAAALSLHSATYLCWSPSPLLPWHAAWREVAPSPSTQHSRSRHGSSSCGRCRATPRARTASARSSPSGPPPTLASCCAGATPQQILGRSGCRPLGTATQLALARWLAAYSVWRRSTQLPQLPQLTQLNCLQLLRGRAPASGHPRLPAAIAAPRRLDGGAAADDAVDRQHQVEHDLRGQPRTHTLLGRSGCRPLGTATQ